MENKERVPWYPHSRAALRARIADTLWQVDMARHVAAPPQNQSERGGERKLVVRGRGGKGERVRVWGEGRGRKRPRLETRRRETCKYIEGTRHARDNFSSFFFFVLLALGLFRGTKREGCACRLGDMRCAMTHQISLDNVSSAHEDDSQASKLLLRSCVEETLLSCSSRSNGPLSAAQSSIGYARDRNRAPTSAFLTAFFDTRERVRTEARAQCDVSRVLPLVFI